ncbi:MAG: hypothetical protein JL50_01545 [Peptococcaceae bacterium BICA1-7]|nr:MAG: hypothetical protein JL50_01545 [Peptococcaceae bacterium BICA1-7]HBV96211.1 hypothetical protein [Desulfotomaculum sp.]
MGPEYRIQNNFERINLPQIWGNSSSNIIAKSKTALERAVTEGRRGMPGHSDFCILYSDREVVPISKELRISA